MIGVLVGTLGILGTLRNSGVSIKDRLAGSSNYHGTPKRLWGLGSRV